MSTHFSDIGCPSLAENYVEIVSKCNNGPGA